MKTSKIFLPILIIVIQLIPVAALPQERTLLTGRVLDGQTLSTLPLANIKILTTQRGTITNFNGKFSLKLEKGTHTLEISMIGYQTLQKTITIFPKTPSQTITIYLQPIVLFMQGITITAPQSLSEKQSDNVSDFQFEANRIKNLPFSLNDINRAVKTLPGISSNNEKSSKFYIRGGGFDENLVQIDGITIYRPFHLKELPNASISILSMAMVSRLSVITGGFSAKYGDKMSSIIDISYRNGNPEKVTGKLEIGTVNSNWLIEGPLGHRISWIAAFNKSYFGPSMRIIRSKFPELLEGIDGVPTFYDFQGKMNFTPSARHHFSFVFLKSSDSYREPQQRHLQSFTSPFKEDYSKVTIQSLSRLSGTFGNFMFALHAYSHPMSSLLSQMILSFYDETENLQSSSTSSILNEFYSKEDTTYLGFGNYSNKKGLRASIRIKTAEFKENLTIKASAFHEVETGFAISGYLYNYFLSDLSTRYLFSNYPDTVQTDTLFYDNNYELQNRFHTKSIKASIYLQDNWQITRKLFMNFGVRGDYFRINQQATLSPRASISYNLEEKGLIKFASGYYYQSPNYYEIKYDYSTKKNTKSQLALHYILGYQRNFTRYFQFVLNGFYKDYKNLIPYRIQDGYKISEQTNSTVGFAKGFDTQIKYKFSALSGWFSYGFLIAKEKKTATGHYFYPRYSDQRHTVSFVFNWKLGKNWQLFGKYFYGSGFPYTPMIFDRTSMHFVPGAIHSCYLPSYERLDLRILKNFELSRFSLTFYFEMINLTNHNNIIAYQHYGFNKDGTISKQGKRLLPITPNVGLSLIFNK